MNPLAIQLTNVGPFPQDEWPIPEGIVSITGDNGSGKSTLIGAIELALFANGSRDLAPRLGSFGERMEICLTFEHDGEVYRVRRGFKKGKATLDLERETPSILPGTEWLPLTRETVAATQALIESTTGLTRRLFNASAFLAQENSGAFTRADPAERKATIGEALDPRDVWPRLAERAKGEAKQAERELVVLSAKMTEREEVATDDLMLERSKQIAVMAQNQTKQDAEQAENTLTAAQAALAANAAAAERVRAAEQAHAGSTENKKRASDELDFAKGQANLRAANLRRYEELANVAATIPHLEQAAEAQRQENADREALIVSKQTAERELTSASIAANKAGNEEAALADELTTVERKRNHLRAAEPDSETCALCHQTLGVQAREASIHEYDSLIMRLNGLLIAKRAEGDELAAKVRAAHEQADRITVPEPATQTDYAGQLTQARAAKEERAALAVTIEGLEASAAKIPALTTAVMEAERVLEEAAVALLMARDETGDQDALERAAAFAKGAVTTARANLDTANAQVTRLDEQLKRAREATTELEALRAEHKEKHRDLDLLRLAESAFHRDGIPALIAENIIPTIEAEANRILERMPTSNGTVFRLEMRTQAPLKGAPETYKETLDILVSDRTTTREFSTYSGGERFRVSFALRWALAKLLRNRRGAQSDILVIDEPDGLDACGMDGLAEILREEAGAFSRIVLVSHNPLLASAFEQTVELISDGEISRIVGGS